MRSALLVTLLLAAVPAAAQQRMERFTTPGCGTYQVPDGMKQTVKLTGGVGTAKAPGGNTTFGDLVAQGGGKTGAGMVMIYDYKLKPGSYKYCVGDPGGEIQIDLLPE